MVSFSYWSRRALIDMEKVMNNSDSLVFASRTLDSGITVEVLQDTDPLNPRDWDNDSLMVCFHKKYDLGDSNTGYNKRDFDSWEELYGHIDRERE